LVQSPLFSFIPGPLLCFFLPLLFPCGLNRVVLGLLPLPLQLRCIGSFLLRFLLTRLRSFDSRLLTQLKT
jgi:hypothetical protein